MLIIKYEYILCQLVNICYVGSVLYLIVLANGGIIYIYILMC